MEETVQQARREIALAKDYRHERGKGSLRRRLGKRFVRVLAGTSFILIMALSSLYFFGYMASYESTDDAFITADVVDVAPKLAGKIERILVADNQMVKQGDPLVEIDSRDYEAQLRQKQAALESVRAQAIAAWAGVEQQIAKVKSLQANVDGNTADEAAAQAQADQTEDDLRREQVLYKRHVVSIQDLTHAQVANRAAQAGLDSVKKKIVAAQAELAEGEAQVRTYQALYQYVLAQEKQSEASLESAQLNVSYTRLYASNSGRITHKSVQAGDYVQVGQALFALVPQDIYVTANFKENQLRLMRAGQPVDIAIDALGGLRFPGHVDSIQMGSGAAFSLLPPENATGNYVKVVQRIPVKIVFAKIPDANIPLGPGESVEPRIKVQDFRYSSLDLTIVIALTIAAILVVFWWVTGGGKSGTPD